MRHGNRRLDIVLALGAAALTLVPWYRIDGGFFGLSWLSSFPMSKGSAPGLLQIASFGRIWILGAVVFLAIAAFAIPKHSLNLEEIAMLALTAAATFAVLDTYIPSIAVGARSGAGFGIGAHLVGWPM